MANTLYERVKELCCEKGISIAKLESDLGFGNSSIKKWEKLSSPSIDKVVKVAGYFGVSTDYLLGCSDIRASASQVIGDRDIISFQRARERMSEHDREKSMQLLRLGFENCFVD